MVAAPISAWQVYQLDCLVKDAMVRVADVKHFFVVLSTVKPLCASVTVVLGEPLRAISVGEEEGCPVSFVSRELRAASAGYYCAALAGTGQG